MPLTQDRDVLRDLAGNTLRDGLGQTNSDTVSVAVHSGQSRPPAPNPGALGRRRLSVLIVGNSNTEGGNLVGRLAQSFRDAYGYYGSG